MKKIYTFKVPEFTKPQKAFGEWVDYLRTMASLVNAVDPAELAKIQEFFYTRRRALLNDMTEEERSQYWHLVNPKKQY